MWWATWLAWVSFIYLSVSYESPMLCAVSTIFALTVLGRTEKKEKPYKPHKYPSQFCQKEVNGIKFEVGVRRPGKCLVRYSSVYSFISMLLEEDNVVETMKIHKSLW